MVYIRAKRRIPIKRKHPQVGPEYQAELPRLIERGQLARANPFNPFLLGIPSVHEDRKERISEAFPELESKVWTEEEREGFLLGLYIFGKNFLLVNKFVETKKMGDLLSFYYGELYNSNNYHLWSLCRKSSAKRFHGKTLFVKWRGEVILARLVSLVGEDHRASLTNSSTRFNDGKLPFEKHVLEMKGIVGVHALLTAIGVGKGKSDLTRAKHKPRKPLEITPPVEPLFSPLEIAELLKRSYSELTKSQSRDFFLRAVWPHLQAQGWHFENIENRKLGLKNTKPFFVFRENKFLTRLIKGDQYFTSIEAVLYEVALNPHILVDEPEEQARVRVRVEERSSSLSSLTTERNGHNECLFDLNEPYVASDSDGDVETARVNDDSYGSVRRPFDLNISHVPNDSGSGESQAMPKRVMEALEVDSFYSNKRMRSE